ncbi:polysaccharide deacetylase family protein [Sphingomonas ginsenosidivorax]|uniref:polysaccharide deacetylase family protein n=1 Tax=Sphingomonas ginsenosidivorax TaxID=862135 RepID=UPI001F54D643|nr:polysaccharide deacetylase family protein [Sphingomonas ginsenosidivorax]
MTAGPAYRVPPATDAQRVAWPASFGTRYTVFVDVEEEFDWRKPLDRANRATTAMAGFADAHRRFVDHGIALACLIDHPIATDPAAVAILSRVVEDGRSEIGTQLHPWVNPPFDEPVTPVTSYAGNLLPALEAAKIDALTDRVADAFGRRPRVYRAGRYGIGPRTVALLAERGYRIDSSVRPGYDYSADGGPDFTALDSGAYRTGGLVELPLTTVFTGGLRRYGAPLHRALGRVPRGRGVFSRAGLLSRIALTPEDMPIEAAIEAVDVAVDDGVRLLTFSFHSPSLVPGHTPYVRDAADLARFHGWWDRMATHLARRGVANATIEDIVAALG